MAQRIPTNERPFLALEDREIIFRNFEGRKTMYNNPGDRNFCLILSEDEAIEFEQDGWRVKRQKPREEGEIGRPYLAVKVQYETSFRPPNVYLVTSGGTNLLDERDVKMIDFAEIKKIDLNIRPHNWSRQDGSSGTTAYLRDIYVTIIEDEFEKRYGVYDNAGASEDLSQGPRFE